MNRNLDFSPSPTISDRESHAAACQSGAGAFTVGSEIRWADATPELGAPSVPFPSRRIFEVAGDYPFAIDEEARDIWLHHLCLAFDDARIPMEVRQEYWDWAEAFSIRMINRRTKRAPLRRYPFPDLHRNRVISAARTGERTQEHVQTPSPLQAGKVARPNTFAPDYSLSLER
jgi:hemoglobin